jgi:hypothetical protein
MRSNKEMARGKECRYTYNMRDNSANRKSSACLIDVRLEIV